MNVTHTQTHAVFNDQDEAPCADEAAYPVADAAAGVCCIWAGCEDGLLG